MSPCSVELTKFSVNAMLALRISFMNEMAISMFFKLTVYGQSLPAAVTAACLADNGNHVLWVIEGFDDGVDDLVLVCPWLEAEPGLVALLEANILSGRLVVTGDIEQGVTSGSLQYLVLNSDEYPLAEKIATTLGDLMEADKTLINRSIFPVGSSEILQTKVLAQLQSRGVVLHCALVVEPDFRVEGRLITDFTRPDRIVLGSTDQLAISQLRELYGPFNRQRDVVMVMSPRSAELTKYSVNAMLATRISFMNEVAEVAEYFGADIEEVRLGMGSDSRIGYEYLYPGTGFGGPNFADDVATFSKTVQEAGCEGRLLESVLDINTSQREVLFRKAWRHFKMNLKGRTFAVWGLSYKPNSEGIRNAPSIHLTTLLLDQGCAVQVFDPAAMTKAKEYFGERDGLDFCENPEACLKGADALVVMTEWKTFWTPNFDLIKAELKQPVIFDGRNLYDPALMERLGITYYGIGRGAPVP
ncbi:MAG: nucleotide sugar dehydrogenase [Methylococcales bacterium]|nr:nucleotide sugar dehydrogenase [Methylococcales bacterium]